MGLENGILVKMKDYGEVKNVFPDYEEYEGEYLPVYFRKCFGIRDDILDRIKASEKGYDYLGGEVEIEKKDLDKVIKYLGYLCGKRYFNSHARSAIWGYEEMVESIKQMKAEMEWFKDYWNSHDDNIERVYFFDSY